MMLDVIYKKFNLYSAPLGEKNNLGRILLIPKPLFLSCHFWRGEYRFYFIFVGRGVLH